MNDVYREYKAELITDQHEKIRYKLITCKDMLSVFDTVKELAREQGLKGNIIHIEVERGIKWQK